jgi:protein-disulfide isomerase
VTAAPPPVRSKGGVGAGPRQASPRTLAIAGGVVLLVIIAIVLGFVLTKGGSSSTGTVSKNDINGLGTTGDATSPTALTGSPDANNLFKGIPQQGLVLGKPSAPKEMMMFIDVQCPICQNYETNYLPTIVQKYVRTGKVQLHLQPWAFLGPQSFTGRLGVIAASLQNRGFQYAKVLYDNQGQEESGWLTGPMMASIAASTTGLDIPQWQKDVNSSGVKSIASDVDKLATQKKVTGTPTVLVGCANGGSLKDIVAADVAPNLQDTQQALDAQNCH